MLGTTPAQIERTLTLAILRGTYAAGTRLPTVRELAARFGVNQATIQRVVARLETRGLIKARQGSGLTVSDPHEAGDLSLMPYWLEATLDDPGRATGILDGFLEVRRILAARLLVRHRARLLEGLDGLAEAAIAMVQAAQAGTDAFRAADLAFARRLLIAAGNTVALAVLNTVAKVLDEVPLVAQAMYGQPRANLTSLAAVMTALRGGAADLGEVVERALADVDRLTVSRFDRLLRARAA